MAGLKSLARKAIANVVAHLPKEILTDRLFFNFFEQHGLHITKPHFYSPIPILSELEESVWATSSEMVGIDMRLESQKQLLKGFVSTFFQEYREISSSTNPAPGEYSLSASSYKRLDGAMLYSMVRDHKPRKMIEIGSGGSTLLTLLALAKNRAETGIKCDFTAIEPYPQSYLRKALDGVGQLLVQPVQKVPLFQFEQLGQGDILFIDSSHVAKTGSDVVYEYLEILPRLRRGVIVHIHDICFPRDYPREWVMDRKTFWNEQYVLQALLSHSTKFKVLWCFSYLKAYGNDALNSTIPEFNPQQHAGPIWLEIAH